ncbi:3-oxoacyl-[acyl-carrier-protein] reductase FabG-like [Bicyclus anynana]|uniref:3-oxoacyl-[acyl-carrier-protein] reductase FabG-like n=1 Tax=Bicyclus anynana TaxID=110368 RepID=A0ABM3LYY8_BICAN|nr:3-oxoacyl-[acyl-carrier-protein] reductase FabG-like [Bicyclus anynana]
MDFNDKVVLITGASSGMGAATAIHFSKLSASLALVGRKENNLKRIALYCEKAKGIKPLSIVADVTDDTALERIVQETIDYFGKIDVLINNAGMIAMGGLKTSDVDTYDKIMAVNMRAVFQLTKLFTPHLIESKGCIVNVSSILGSKVTTQCLSYSLSKAALDQFTKCVALELAADGVRVNSVNPSYVKTNLLKDIGLTEDQLELYTQNFVSKTPLKRLVEGDEVASLISFLASDRAKSITGTCNAIDAGKSLS